MSKIILEAKGVYKRFTEGPTELEILHDVNVSIFAGEFVAIVGSSGSGKTTLLHLLGGLDTPSQGSIRICDQDIVHCSEEDRGFLRNQHMGFVYQFHHLLPEFTALENVCMPLLLRADCVIKQAQQSAKELLERVGLGHRLDHKPSELSGGERQRVALARALVTKPAIVLADEPTGNLDNHTSQEIQALFLEMNQELETSFVVVTHDLVLANKAKRVLNMQEGCLFEEQ